MEQPLPRKLQGDDSESSSHATESNVEPSTKMPPNARAKEEIAAAESRRVTRLRVIVLLTLLISTITVSVVVFKYLESVEAHQFEDQFLSDATKVLDSVGKTLDDTFGAADAFGIKLIAYARYSNSSWPVSLKECFEQHRQMKPEVLT